MNCKQLLFVNILLFISILVACTPVKENPLQNQSLNYSPDLPNASNSTIVNNITVSNFSNSSNSSVIVIVQNVTVSNFSNVSNSSNMTPSTEQKLADSALDFQDSGKQCHYYLGLKKGELKSFEISSSAVSIELLDFKVNDPDYLARLYNKDNFTTDYVKDWVKLNLNDEKTIQIPIMGLMEASLDSGTRFYLAAPLIRDENVFVCINTGEPYDMKHCESKSGAERSNCFDNLGYLNGIEYCGQISNEADRKACERGATL
jgi:hypothetical protein